LYEYFFGGSAEQDSVLKEGAFLDMEIESVKQELASSELSNKLNELLILKKRNDKVKKAIEKERIKNQLPIWLIEKENDASPLQLPSLEE